MSVIRTIFIASGHVPDTFVTDIFLSHMGLWSLDAYQGSEIFGVSGRGVSSEAAFVVSTHFQRHARGVKRRPAWLKREGFLGGPSCGQAVVGLHLPLSFVTGVQMKVRG